MSRYDWPTVPGGGEEHDDDPAGRGRFMARRRLDFDPIGALVAGRLPSPAPAPAIARRGRKAAAPPIEFAMPSGRTHLWQPLGPMTVVEGQVINQGRVAGRVSALAVQPNGPRVYAATGNGGVWYSPDAGATWRSLGGFAPTATAEVNRPAQRHACGSIFVSFGSSENLDLVLVGTGETHYDPNAQPGHSLGGIGVLTALGPASMAATSDPWLREGKNLLGNGVAGIAMSPSTTTVVVATKHGLFQRPSPSAADTDWDKVAGAPFADLSDECSDVLWTAGDVTRPERLWVWVANGSHAGLWMRPAGATDFTQIATPGSSGRTGLLAAATPPDTVYLFNDRGPNTPALFQITAAGPGNPVAKAVAGVPDIIKAQGFYDMAIAVHPTLPNRVVLGGAVADAVTPDGSSLWGAGIVSADVTVVGTTPRYGTAAAPFTMIGVGVHADMHDLVFSGTGDRLWAACDGGVYRSDAPTKQTGFVPCNTGLAILEADYVVNHPNCEGFVLTGLQDNGVIARLSTGVWHTVGIDDAGGIALDPRKPDRFLRQHFNGSWSTSDGTLAKTGLLTRGTTFAQAENDAAAFYSTPAAIAHHRAAPAPAAPDITQVILGTTRLWYTENFGASWVTLPTGLDPLPGNPSQDDFGEAITVCRWQGEDVAWVLGEGTVMRYARTPGSDAGSPPGTWAWETVIKRNVKNKKDATSADGPIRDAAVWTDLAVNLDPAPGANQPPAPHGAKGAVYLGTIGKAEDTEVDTLWWFDGDSHWHPTGLRNDPHGVPAPVTSLLCEPQRPDEVWVGTTVGVWHGLRTLHGADPPTWAWEAMVNGLPEAAVEDLTMFDDSGIRLLRAAIAARGAWELRLDVPEVADLTYVRAHDDDLRYRARAVATQRDLVTARSWHGSPDVRPRRAPVAVAAPSTLPWTAATFTPAEDLRRFQAALRSRTGDPRIRATGGWDRMFNEALRDLGAPILAPPAAANTVSIDAAFWNLSMVAPHDTVEPWGAGVPQEADLHELVAPLREGELAQTSCSFPPGPTRVEVVVHHRGLDSVDGANVGVTLLRWVDSRTTGAAQWNNSTTWPTGNVPWAPAVNEVLNSASGATALTFGPEWVFADAANPRHILTGQTLDAMHSGVATFDLDLSGLAADTVVLVAAVIRAGTTPADNSALSASSLPELALTSANVAVRSLRIS